MNMNIIINNYPILRIRQKRWYGYGRGWGGGWGMPFMGGWGMPFMGGWGWGR
jgi:hypothetical protein